MNCQRASEIDPNEFCQDSSGPQTADFRAHYPRCPDCAAEVETWTAVHSLLAGTTMTHPAPKKLSWFGERPQSLPADERDTIAAHVTDCRLCRDELTTLRTLDLYALTRPLASIEATVQVPAPAAAEVPVWWRALLGPRLAFVVVMLGIVPLLVSRVEPPLAPVAAPASEPARVPAVPSPVPSAERAPTAKGAIAPPPVEDKRPAKRERLAPPPPPVRPEAVASAKPAAQPPVTRPAPVAAPRADAPRPSDADLPKERAQNRARLGEAAGALARSEPAPVREREREQAAQAIGGSLSEPAPAGRATAPSSPPPRAVSLQAANATRITLDDHTVVTLLAPSRTPTTGSTADVRIVAAAQSRELRQQGSLRDGTVATDVAPGWFTPGDYQVEVTVAGVLTVYRLTVAH